MVRCWRRFATGTALKRIQKEENNCVFKHQITIQRKTAFALRAEYLRDVSGHRLSDERRRYDKELRHHPLADLGRRQRRRLHRVRILRTENPEGARGVLIQGGDVGLRRDVHLSKLAFHERDVDGIRGHGSSASRAKKSPTS